MARTRPIPPDTVQRPTNALPCCRKARPARHDDGGDGGVNDDGEDGGDDDGDDGDDDDGPIVA